VKGRRKQDAGTSYLQRGFAWIQFVQIVSELRVKCGMWCSAINSFHGGFHGVPSSYRAGRLFDTEAWIEEHAAWEMKKLVKGTLTNMDTFDNGSTLKQRGTRERASTSDKSLCTTEEGQ